MHPFLTKWEHQSLVIVLEIAHPTLWYSKSGSPTCSISGIVHLKSKALLRTILKIFCTLMLWLVELKMRLAFMALAKRLACSVVSR